MTLPDQTALLRAAVDISHLGVRVKDENAFLEAVADVFRGSFGLFAAQVFLKDSSGLFGELRHHVGEGERRTIAKAPGVPVGGNSDLSKVLEGQPARAIQDMASLPTNAVPEGVQSAIALPLNVEGRVLGAIVLYSSSPEFGAGEIASFTPLADMAALALENIRAWHNDTSSTARAAEGPQRLLETGPFGGLERPVRYTLGDGEAAATGGHSTPIKLHGSVIGSLNLRGAGDREFEPGEVELIESVADQVALAIENLSLLESARKQAEREQTINAVTAQLQRATTVDGVLRAAAQAVRATLGNVDVTARLSADALAVSPVDGDEA